MPTSDASVDTHTPGGHVEIADTAIVSLIQEAVLSCYGVVEIGPRSLGSSIVHRLGIGNRSGIDIENKDGALTVEVSIVVEFGTPIFTVAQNVMQAVKFQIEHLLSIRVDRVNVNVDGLRMSAPIGSTS